jgi:hypothetical protein
MKLVQTICAALAMSALLVALPGCEKQEGPMEQAGKKVDQGVENAGKQIGRAGDSIQEATKVDKE